MSSLIDFLNRFNSDYSIEDNNEYIVKQKQILKYEKNNPIINAMSLLLLPLLFVYKSTILLKDIIVLISIVIYGILIDILYNIILITIEFYYEKIINLFNICIIPICMYYSYDNVLNICCFTFIFGFYINLFIRYQKYLIKSFYNTNEKKLLNNLKYFKLFQIILYIFNIVNNTHISQNKINYLILSLFGLISDVMYNLVFTLYVYYSDNIILLDRYGLVERIDNIINIEQKNKIDNLLEFRTYNHECNKNDNGSCSECPCGICFENLTESVKLKCNHIFDLKCIRTWSMYEFNKFNKIQCPTCRENLV
jgi:hypothetical protein